MIPGRQPQDSAAAGATVRRNSHALERPIRCDRGLRKRAIFYRPAGDPERPCPVAFFHKISNWTWIAGPERHVVEAAPRHRLNDLRGGSVRHSKVTHVLSVNQIQIAR